MWALASKKAAANKFYLISTVLLLLAVIAVWVFAVDRYVTDWICEWICEEWVVETIQKGKHAT